MKKYELFVVALLFWLASGCANVDSDDVKPETVVPTYSADFDESQGTLKLTASFTVGDGLGTYVRLRDPSRVLVDSEQLADSEFLGIITYTKYKNETGYLGGSNHRWEFYDQDQNRF